MSDRTRRRDRRDPDARGAFAVECPGCRAHVAVTRDLVGRAAGCPGCRGAFLVPAPHVPTPRPAARLRTPAAPGGDAATAQPARTAVEPALPRVHDEPIVFADPPLPSTRRRAQTIPSPDPAAAPEIGSGPPPVEASDAGTRIGPDEAAALSFREPVKIVRSGGAEIELRRLTPEEKRARRARRNLVILVVGAALLVALVVILGKGGGPHPRP